MAFVVGILAFALAGCSLFFTGGGWMPSSLTEGKKASFGFTYKGEVVEENVIGGAESVIIEGFLKGTYHDHGKSPAFPKGVAFKFNGGTSVIKLNLEVPQDLQDSCMGSGDPFAGGLVAENLGRFNYVSQVPSMRGSGVLAMSACDTETLGAELGGDFLIIDVLTGPFMGYSNKGEILGGNFKNHVK